MKEDSKKSKNEDVIMLGFANICKYSKHTKYYLTKLLI